MSICYLNGSYMPLAEATISPMDRGFLYGDGIYEVIPIYNDHLFSAAHHLARLRRSLAAVEIHLDCSEQDWHKIFARLLADASIEFGYVYIQVTRGVGQGRSQRIPTDLTPTVFVYIQQLPVDHSRKLHKGISAVTMEDMRHKNCHIKATNLLANALSTSAAHQSDSDEAILLRDGYAIESSSSNLFIVQDGVIKTTPLMPQILAGVTREVVIDLARKNAIPVVEEMITISELFAADEVWLTSSTREIAPVIEIDQHQIGLGEPGYMWRKMHRFYQEAKEQAATEIEAAAD